MIDRRAVLASLLAVPLHPPAARMPMTIPSPQPCSRPWPTVSTIHGPSPSCRTGTSSSPRRPGALRTIGRRPEAVGADLRPAGDRRTSARAGFSTSHFIPNFAQTRLVFLSFAEPREEGKNATSVMRGQAVGGSSQPHGRKVIFRQQPAYQGRPSFRLAPRLRPHGRALRHHGRPAQPARRWFSRPDNHIGKVIRITEDGGIPPDNPKRRGLASRDLVHRPPQPAGRHHPSGDGPALDGGTRRQGRRRAQPSRRRARTMAGPIVTYGREYSGEHDRRGPDGEGRASSSPSITGTRRSRPPAWRSTPATGIRSGRATSSSAHWRRSIWRASCSTTTRWWRRSASMTARSRIRDVRQGPDGYLYMLTDEAAPMGRVMRVTP